MKNILFTIFILLFSLCPLHPSSATEDKSVEYPEQIAARLQARYDAIKTLSFTFHQTTGGELTGRVRNGSGKALFYKIGGTPKMRWDYIEPDKQILFSDGTSFNMYFSELNQMIVTPADQLETDITYSFFSGQGNLQRDFYIRPADEQYQGGENDSLSIIKIIPQTPHAQVQNIHLWVTDESLIRRIVIRDHFGTLTTLNLSDIVVDGLLELDKEAAEALFSYTPPEGTEIIRQ